MRTARLAFRTSPDGGMLPQLIISLLQRRRLPDPGNPWFEGGCTIIADLRNSQIKYCIRKSANSPGREARQQAFAEEFQESLRAVYFGPEDVHDQHLEPFALMHGCH